MVIISHSFLEIHCWNWRCKDRQMRFRCFFFFLPLEGSHRPHLIHSCVPQFPSSLRDNVLISHLDPKLIQTNPIYVIKPVAFFFILDPPHHKKDPTMGFTFFSSPIIILFPPSPSHNQSTTVNLSQSLQPSSLTQSPISSINTKYKLKSPHFRLSLLVLFSTSRPPYTSPSDPNQQLPLHSTILPTTHTRARKLATTTPHHLKLTYLGLRSPHTIHPLFFYEKKHKGI